MKDTNIHEMIKERFEKLPPKLQEAITSTEVALKLREISQEHHLHIDQGQVLENETYMVLLGIEQSENYKENLKKELRVPEAKAIEISNDVAKEIFLSVRNTLKKTTTIPQRKEIRDIKTTTTTTPSVKLDKKTTLEEKTPTAGDSSQGIMSDISQNIMPRGDSSQGIVHNDSQGIIPIDKNLAAKQTEVATKTQPDDGVTKVKSKEPEFVIAPKNLPTSTYKAQTKAGNTSLPEDIMPSRIPKPAIPERNIPNIQPVRTEMEETKVMPTATTITSVSGTETKSTNKLDSIVRNKPKEVNVVTTKGYTVDPYRELID